MCQRLGFYLADVEREIAKDGFRLDGGLVHQHEGPRNAPLGMLPGGLFKEEFERLAPTVEAVPVMQSRQRFEFKHGRCF